MNVRIIAGYQCPVLTSAEPAPAEAQLQSVTFNYRCNLVFPAAAGPNYAVKIGDQLTDVFDFLRVRYDGTKVQASMAAPTDVVSYELVGGSLMKVDGTVQPVTLGELDHLLQQNPYLLIKMPMVVHELTAEPTSQPVTVAAFSGNWTVGDSRGFADWLIKADSDYQMEIKRLVATIDDLKRHQQVLRSAGVNLDDHRLRRAEMMVRGAEVTAWYELSRRKVDFVTTISKLHLAYLANLQVVNALKNAYPEYQV